MEADGTNTGDFIKEAPGPSGLVGVFEDDGETGYLYLYEPEGPGVMRHLHIYDRTPELNIAGRDVEIEWSEDQTKCGVRIWGKMRGIINLTSGEDGRVWLTNPNTPGISDAQWMKGFRR